MPRFKTLPEIIQLILIGAGFGGAILAYRTYYPDNYAYLTPDEVGLGFFISVGAMWIAVKLLETSGPVGFWARMMDEFCVGTGINLIVDAVLNYFEILTRSLYLIVVGSLLAVLLLGLGRLLVPRVKGTLQPGFLMIGYDAVAHRLAAALGLPLLGVVGVDGGPPGVQNLGDCAQFEEIAARVRPARIVIAGGAAGACVAPAQLLAQRLRGVPVSDLSGLYENFLGRIYCRGFDPADLVLSQALTTNSRTLAIQAIYTNLIGMFLLAAAAPVMLLVSLAVALFCGPGPVIESGEYCGFRNIPFRLMRFRTRRKDGARTVVGSWIRRLRLDLLPQLLHIVRGEMALFGPRPVRREFAQRLTGLMPFYGMRFSVKPGLLGWAQLKLRGESERTCELTEIEYDLYYIKRGSPLLDLDILAGNLLGGSGRVPAAETAP